MFGITSLIENLKGDKSIWGIVSLLALFSFLPVYSASSNLVYIYGRGNTFSFLLKHFIHLVIGYVLIYTFHRISYHSFRSASKLMISFMVPMLLFTLMQGTLIGGANASRWITIPIIGLSFQPSTVAFLVLIVYVARHLSKHYNKEITFKQSLLRLWMPVAIIVMLILPANLSTAALIFLMVLTLVFVSGYPIKYISYILLSGVLFLTIFMGAAKVFPNAFPNRVDTWISRIENFASSDESNPDENYQVEVAKTAIATGGAFGLGPGKSLQKNFLPQSSSDFIFAIIVEEYGLAMAAGIIFLYMLLLFRFIVQAGKAPTVFGRLLILGLGIWIISQALINMSVAVNMFPVTGQTLPLISSGGTSIWMTCIALGIILSVTNHEAPELELASDTFEQNEFLTEEIKETEVNPLQAVKNK